MIHAVRGELRGASTSERDKDEMFVGLIAKSPQTDSIHSVRCAKVCHWMDYPDRDGKVDTGVSVFVAEEAGERDLVPIQRKFHAYSGYLSKREIDLLLAGSLPPLDVTES